VSQPRGLADELLEENLLDMQEPHFEIPRFTSIGGRRIRRRSRTLTRGARDMEKVIKQFTASQPKPVHHFIQRHASNPAVGRYYRKSAINPYLSCRPRRDRIGLEWQTAAP
jgi:hypothetical protein